MHPEEESALSSEMMPEIISAVRFRYFLSSCSEAVEEDGGIWCSALPLCRNPQTNSNDESAGPTYGDYFLAVRRFLEDRQFRSVVSAISTGGKQSCRACDIISIDIFLVKHGQFYHPCRVEVLAKEQVFAFVVNAALSIFGKSGIEREFNLLDRLSSTPSGAYLPNVYGYGGVILPKGWDVKLFIGEWFEDFHEFHISLDPIDHQYKIRVWQADAVPVFLTGGQTLELYRQIAEILTGCYDPETFEQIFPWHHAAGDFIVRRSDNLLQVKLITVRQYGALLETPDRDEATLMQAMLFFLSIARSLLKFL